MCILTFTTHTSKESNNSVVPLSRNHLLHGMFIPTLKRTKPISERKKKEKTKENERLSHAETVNRLKTWWSNEAVVNL